MSNERVLRTAEAVNDLRKALELWCDRGDGAVTLGVRRAASNALAAADTAIEELWKIRRETAQQVKAYNVASAARTDALFAEMAPPAPVPALRTEIGPLPVDPALYAPADRTVTANYRCGDCGRVFPVDPTDPMTAHGDYLDHMEEHERADAEEDPVAHEPVGLLAGVEPFCRACNVAWPCPAEVLVRDGVAT